MQIEQPFRFVSKTGEWRYLGNIRVSWRELASGIHDTLGDALGYVVLTERFPGESDEGEAGRGIGGPEIRHVREQHADRIAVLDEGVLLARLRRGEREEDHVAGRDRLPLGQRDDGMAVQATLDLRDALLAGGNVFIDPP